MARQGPTTTGRIAQSGKAEVGTLRPKAPLEDSVDNHSGSPRATTAVSVRVADTGAQDRYSPSPALPSASLAGMPHSGVEHPCAATCTGSGQGLVPRSDHQVQLDTLTINTQPSTPERLSFKPRSWEALAARRQQRQQSLLARGADNTRFPGNSTV